MKSPFPTEPSAEFMNCIRSNVTVNQAASHGISLERCIIALCAHLQEYERQLAVLSSCAPKGVVHEGKLYVWQCPDNLIPESQIQRL